MKKLGFVVLMLCFAALEGRQLTLEFHRKNMALSIDFLAKLQHFFKADFFVETGTYVGNTTINAAKIFPAVYTVELSSAIYNAVLPRLADYPNIYANLGESSHFLRQLLPRLANKRGMIFLDAHFSGGITAKGNENTPIVSELKIIQEYAPDSIILIDDLRFFQNHDVARRYVATHPGEEAALGYVTMAELKSLLLAINPEYEFAVWGDLGIAFPKNVYPDIELSPVLQALTRSRLVQEQADLVEAFPLEKALLAAQGKEREAIRSLLNPDEGLSQPHAFTTHYRLWAGLTFLGEGNYQEACKLFEQALQDGLPAWRISPYMLRM